MEKVGKPGFHVFYVSCYFLRYDEYLIVSWRNETFSPSQGVRSMIILIMFNWIYGIKKCDDFGSALYFEHLQYSGPVIDVVENSGVSQS